MNESNEDDAYLDALEEHNQEKTFKTLSRASYENMSQILKDDMRAQIIRSSPREERREILLKENGWTLEEYNAELTRRILEALNG